jgi:superfamily II DNA or RNA helicase
MKRLDERRSAAEALAPRLSAMERLRFAVIRDGPLLPGGSHVGMATAPVEAWPHQAVVARRLVDDWPASFLLCDEVGLGKTIEAGLAIRSLHLSGLAARVLVAAPASLTAQWHREMASKFLLSFGRALGGRQTRHEYLLPAHGQRPARSLYEPDLVIISTALMARTDRRGALRRARRFDIALIDEAQAVRRKNPTQGVRAHPRYGHLYTTVSEYLRPKSHCLLMATATPMQLDPVETADLVALTRRVGAFELDPSLLITYYALLARFVRGGKLDEYEWALLHRSVSALRREDPSQWDFVTSVVVDQGSGRAARRWLRGGGQPSAGPAMKRMLFAASPLSRVMLRHTRPLLEIYRDRGRLDANLARRVVLPLDPVRFSAGEQEIYESLEAYCRGLTRQIRRRDRTALFAVGIMLSFLRLRFASSLYAIEQSLRRRVVKVRATLARLETDEPDDLEEVNGSEALDEDEDDREAVTMILKDRAPGDLRWELEALSGCLITLDRVAGPSSKMTRLTDLIHRRRDAQGRVRQTVIFTRFYDTLTDIVRSLLRVDPGVRLGTYSGRGGARLDTTSGLLADMEREEVKREFLRGEIDVLICTDAAAEGLNLQTADLLVNFDLPWNPMKVEQRIGRIDRIGQVHETIYVENLCYLNSAEEIVYGRLLARLSEAGHVVGTQRMSLLPVTAEEFRLLADGRLSEEEVSRRALERVELTRERATAMEISAEELYEVYERLAARQANGNLPVDLASIWDALAGSDYLAGRGCRIQGEQGDCMELRNVPGLPAGTWLTAARDTYERGVRGAGGELRFASYGEPAFDALLEHLTGQGLPRCARRIAFHDRRFGAERVVYAAACRDPSGLVSVRAVRAYSDLRDLHLAEDTTLDEAMVEALRRELESGARAEFRARRGVARLERRNGEAARSQIALDYLVAAQLLRARQRFGQSGGRFWQELGAMDDHFRRRNMIRVTGIPVATAQRLGELLFDVEIGEDGEEAVVDAPRTLLASAMDAAARVADGQHTARARLSVEAVIRALDREVGRLIGGGE